ncbi:uncharacterized protein METZ01_LOCUS435680, partial [marine metagenome]
VNLKRSTFSRLRPASVSYHANQMLACVAVGVLCNLVGCALGDYQPATLSPFRAKIHDPVSALDHIEMMFDDDDRVAVTPESEQYLDELVDISQSETCGWLIEDVDGVL